MRFLKLTLLSISMLPMGLKAAPAKEPKASFWEQKTCYTQGILRVCTTVALQLYQDWAGPGTGTALVALHTGPDANTAFPILPSAIGFLAKGPLGFEPRGLSSPGGCDGDTPDRWMNPQSGHVGLPTLGGYTLMTGSGAVDDNHWQAVNECQSGDLFAWKWQGQLPKDILLVWRGESEDGTVDFDCFEDPKGGEDCLSAAKSARFASTFNSLSTVSTVPEPSTIALLSSGMVALALVIKRQRARSPHKHESDSA